ncbi:hypothetical protein CASFOL_005895 [Castilleja foliolosa]|uniref:Uncharacterized protein n=1 Tax=Castilleja foliolosa TaxID=1961234 RepID=A0ABD3E6S7_9LAMI
MMSLQLGNIIGPGRGYRFYDIVEPDIGNALLIGHGDVRLGGGAGDEGHVVWGVMKCLGSPNLADYFPVRPAGYFEGHRVLSREVD